MANVRTRWAALCVAVLFCHGAMAQTFYVAPDGVDQSSGGSQQSPWATIGFATSNVPDGAVIEVLPGTYNGRSSLNGQFDAGITVRSSVPYQARLRHNRGAALICFTCRGVTVEGFDIAHATDNVGGLVIQVQDLLGSVNGSDSGTDEVVSSIVFRNNIVHDSTDNDLLKINNGAEDVLVEGNMFFNQSGSDEHIDANSVIGVTIRDNIFFNTTEQNATSSFIVVKDSNSDSDTVLGTQDTVISRNLFLNWQGSGGQSFVRIGEDSTSSFEADGVLIENNLLLGNSNTLMRSALTIQGSRDIVFRHNTVVGDLPSRSFAARLLALGPNQPNDQVVLANNVWSDPTGSMGSEGLNAADLFEAPSSAFDAVTVNNNLYFNGGNGIPSDPSQDLSVADDSAAIIADSLLPSQLGLVVPAWDGNSFPQGQSRVREVFVDLVRQFGTPAPGSPMLGTADPADAASDDIFGNPRTSLPDLGAMQVDPFAGDRIFRDGFEN